MGSIFPKVYLWNHNRWHTKKIFAMKRSETCERINLVKERLSIAGAPDYVSNLWMHVFLKFPLFRQRNLHKKNTHTYTRVRVKVKNSNRLLPTNKSPLFCIFKFATVLMIFLRLCIALLILFYIWWRFQGVIVGHS